MIGFVNAKINIGLNIVGRREDGYHLLETVMYPVGVYAGTPRNPEQFCDILEIIVNKRDSAVKESKGLQVDYRFSGNPINCGLESNLVCRGVNCLLESVMDMNPLLNDKIESIQVLLDKHLPDGAGMGGGSADAVFSMKLLRDSLLKEGFKVSDDDELLALAGRIGADCPFFVDNRPALAEGIGEKLTPIKDVLAGKWLLVVKPDLSISTKEAYSGVTPSQPEIPLADALRRPLSEWRGAIHNDFEDSLFPKYPELGQLKNALYENGAVYASMTGSGAALYGIFHSKDEAEAARSNISSPYSSVLLL